MYYVDYLEMISSCLKPSLGSIGFDSKLINHKRLSLQKKNQNLIKPLFASIFFILCIIVVPEKPPNLASICEKYKGTFYSGELHGKIKCYDSITKVWSLVNYQNGKKIN